MRHAILIVTDDHEEAQALTAIAARFSTPLSATGSDAPAHLATHIALQAIILCLSRPVDRTLTVLRRAREAKGPVPALVIAPRGAQLDLNLAFDLGATVIEEPLDARRVEEFLLRASPLDARLEAASAEWGERYGVSATEREILLRYAHGEGRSLIARQRKCSELTVKKHISNLLSKVAAESLGEAVARLLREAGTGRSRKSLAADAVRRGNAGAKDSTARESRANPDLLQK